MAYTQNFKSLKGTLYTVTVDNVTASLPLAANPIETQEDDEKDMFKPVRTQSGYIRMVNTDNVSWKQFIPDGVLAKPVTLTTGGTVVWKGYVQTGTYGMTYPALYEEFELPLICPLAALDSLEVDAQPQNISQTATIGQLLGFIFGKLNDNTLTFNFHVGSGTSVQTWLDYSFLWSNLLDGDGNVRFSCLGLLEEVCKFFGWSCRIQGNNVYFTSIADSVMNTQFLRCNLDALSNSSRSFTPVSMSSVDFDNMQSNPFANTNQTEEFIPGIKSATINSELNPYSVVSELPTNEYLKAYRYGEVHQGMLLIWKVPGGVTPLNDFMQVLYIKLESGTFNGDDVTMTTTTVASPSDNANTAIYGRSMIIDANTNQDELRNWTAQVECFHGHSASARSSSQMINTPLFSIETKDAFLIAGGVLYIKSSVPGVSGSLANYPFAAKCILRIGNNSNDYKWWDPVTNPSQPVWRSDHAVVFNIPCTCGGGIQSNHQSGQPDFEGYGVAISEVLKGKIYFAIGDVTIPTVPAPLTADLNGWFPITGLTIGLARMDEDTEANDQNYTATGGAFPEKVELDTAFCSDKTKTISGKQCKSQLGFGMIFNDSGPVDQIPYGGGENAKPEQHYAGVIAGYGANIKRVMTLDVITTLVGNVGPAYRCTFDSENFSPVSVSHRWRDDITTLKLMKI